jgi:hypothetical protein
MIGRMHHVVLDCPDPPALATSGLAFQRAPGNRPSTWPDPEVLQQIHLEIMVEDPATAGPQVLAIGAVKLDGEDVYGDPAGHPFCLIRRPRWAPPISATR